MALKLKSSVKMDGRIILDRFIPEINLSNNTVAENASIGTVVGTASVQNAGGSTFTFELVDEGSTGDFSMTTGGVISVASALNHEEQSTYPVQIKSIDSRGHKYAIATNLVVGDINEPPVDITLSNNEIEIERVNIDRVIGIATATDPDANDPKTWTLLQDASGRFTIDSNTGELQVNGSLLIGSNTVEIQVEDSGNLTYSEQFVIEVSAETQQVVALDANTSAFFGFPGIDFSADGLSCVIAAGADDTIASNAGAVYIFERTSAAGSWSQAYKINANDAQSGDAFGYSASMNDAGDRIVVGAHFEDTRGSNAGAIYIFHKAGSSWSQEQKFAPAILGSNDQFGFSSAISGDGNYVVVGAFGYDTASTNAGLVYVYNWNGSSWQFQQELVNPWNGTDNKFGFSVDIDQDGDTIVVGAYEYDGSPTGPYTDFGYVVVYARSGSTWSQQSGVIQEPNPDFANLFGGYVSISDDGNTIAACAYWAGDGGKNRSGRVHIFNRTSGVWAHTQQLSASDKEDGGYFGRAVRISGDASTLLVGAYLSDFNSLSNVGRAYIFTNQSGTWIEQAVIVHPNFAAQDRFGWGLGITPDGSTICVGARERAQPLDKQGAAYFYNL